MVPGWHIDRSRVSPCLHCYIRKPGQHLWESRRSWRACQYWGQRNLGLGSRWFGEAPHLYICNNNNFVSEFPEIHVGGRPETVNILLECPKEMFHIYIVNKFCSLSRESNTCTMRT